ncbi:MAG: amino acid permease [Xanthomonadales bacterium]|nr:amino acid permease [Xanthomonadales bacterium]
MVEPAKTGIETETGLKREISRLGFAAISLNGVIGAGIFALPAVAAAAGGLFSPWLFLICSLMIMTVVLSIARAASFFAGTGGPLAYVGHAFGPFAGFQIGWLYAFSRVTAFAANINLLLTYAAWFWAPLGQGLARHIALTLMCAFFTWVNVVGLRRGMQAIFVFTLLKLIPLALVVLLGLTHLNPEVFTGAGLPAFDGLGETLLVLFYAFVGFEGAAVPAGEARNPQRDIPRALISSVIAITVLYVSIQMVAVSVIPELGSSKAPLADVALVLMGSAGAALMAAGAVFSVGGNCSSIMFNGPRMVYAMSCQQLLPRWFGAIHPRHGTPANAILFVGGLALFLSLSGSFVWLAAMSTVVRLLVYVACILALPRLHTMPGDRAQPFKLPGGYLIPLMALILCGWLMTFASSRSWLTTAAFSAIGAVFYLATRKR